MKLPSLPSVKVFGVLFASAFGLMIVLSLVGHALAASLGQEAQKFKPAVLAGFFGLFLLTAFSAAPLLIRLFFKGFAKVQTAVGNEAHPLIRSLIASQDKAGTILILVYWGIFVAGLIIASPHLMKLWSETMAA